ncbi:MULTISPECIES: cation:proton antiporter domain-containing protein [Kitasatospora]|uniref:Cation:proton antiporter n=1 Tax=Kitasatospora cathayae TaxID=3004092 RepID=A0ABY7Q6E2_9ACTN|nr:cation:proton antiporter [Kitasatospora sp. HUAS 3-15]WBP88277.1 cation:proton antiporter [Kitasatospora sp. HUAS 3-15]
MKSPATAADLHLATMLAGAAAVLLTGLVFGRLATRFRQPVVIGEIVAGIALGPSLLGHLPGDLPHRLFPAEVRPLLNAVAQVGLMLFMFMVGWEFDKNLLRPHKGTATMVSLTSVGFAFACGTAIASVLYRNHHETDGRPISFTAFAMFMGTAMSVTAFPVLARILKDNRLSHTRVGVLALASAAVDDLLAWCLLAYVSALATADGNGRLLQVGLLSAVYVALMFLVVRPLLAGLVGRLVARQQWRPLLLLLCAGVFLSSWLTTWIGIHAIFGAFLFGFVMPREPAHLLKERLHPPLEHVSTLLLPVYFVVIGLGVDIGGLGAYQYLELTLIVAVACAGKLLGALVPAKFFGLSWAESRTLGLLMNTRGLTELIILNAAASLGVLDGQMFTMMVIMALLTTALAGPLLPVGPPVLEPEPLPSRRRDLTETRI